MDTAAIKTAYHRLLFCHNPLGYSGALRRSRCQSICLNAHCAKAAPRHMHGPAPKSMNWERSCAARECQHTTANMTAPAQSRRPSTCAGRRQRAGTGSGAASPAAPRHRSAPVVYKQNVSRTSIWQCQYRNIAKAPSLLVLKHAPVPVPIRRCWNIRCRDINRSVSVQLPCRCALLGKHHKAHEARAEWWSTRVAKHIPLVHQHGMHAAAGGCDANTMLLAQRRS